jgi:septum formation protein
MNSLPNLFLASQSPRRAQLLETLGLPYQVIASHSDEEDPHWQNVDEITQKNSLLKAKTVIEKIPDVNAIVIAADTLVVLGQEVISKPKDVADAKAILQKLSGQRQTVVTGLTLLSNKYGLRQACVKSFVYFHSLTQKQIEEYTSTREPYDKSGGYAVQGLGSLFINKIEGSYTNVMGLPIEKLLEELAALTGIQPYQWFLKKI